MNLARGTLRRTRRTALARISSLGMVSLLAAACGAGVGRRGQEPAAPAASKPQGTVTFWHNWTTRGPLLRVYLDQFELANPGVKVEDTDVSTMGGRAKVPTAIISGTAPDMLHVFVDMIPQLTPSKALLNLSPYVTRDKVDLRQFFDSEIKARTVDGALIAMPVVVAANAHFVYWNKSVLQRAGLDPDQGPRTWSQAQEMALKLTTKQGNDVQKLGLDPGVPVGGDVFSNQFIRWLYHNGGRLFTEDGRKVAFHEPEGSAALEWLQQTVSRQGSIDTVSKAAGANAFFRGDLAMIVQQDNFGSQMRVSEQAKGMAWGVSLLPLNDKNPRAKVSTPAIGGHGYGVPKDAKNIETAWQLTRFLTYQDPACSFLTKDQGRLSPLRRCSEIPEAKAASEFRVFVAGAEAGVFVPNTTANAMIAAMLKDAVQTVYDGKASPKAALEDAARAAQVELDKALAQAK